MIANFIWDIADDVLRNLFVRGKYRGVILPITVPRRLGAMPEPAKQAVLDIKVAHDRVGIIARPQPRQLEAPPVCLAVEENCAKGCGSCVHP